MTFYFWNWWTCIPELFKTHFYISEIFALVIRRLIIDIMRLETKKYIGNNEFRLETKFVDGKQSRARLYLDWNHTLETCWLETVIWRLERNIRNNVNWKHKIGLETKTYIGNIVMRLVTKNVDWKHKN